MAKLCFWNDGKPKLVNSKMVELADGAVIFNAQPNPDIDLYEYKEVSVMGDAAGVSYSNNGWRVTKTTTIVTPPAPTAEEIAAQEAATRQQLIRSAADACGELIFNRIPLWKTQREQLGGQPISQVDRDWAAAMRQASNGYEIAVLAADTLEDALAIEIVWPVAGE